MSNHSTFRRDLARTWLAALHATVIFCGCAAGETPSNVGGELFALDSGHDAGTAPSDGMRLVTSDGDEIAAKSLRCTYREKTGVEHGLDVQLQYLNESNGLAFALYLKNPTPATPFAGRAGEVDEVDFEAYADGLNYRSELSHAEITLNLESLPAPTSVQPGETVHLKGNLSIQPFSLPEVSALGEVGPSTLELAAGSVAVDCTPSFQTAVVLN